MPEGLFDQTLNEKLYQEEQAKIQSTSDRIIQVQADLFAIRQDLRDTLDDAKDARFIRLCAELGVLANEFLPEESPKKADFFGQGEPGWKPLKLRDDI